jgi:hypothetical protein
MKKVNKAGLLALSISTLCFGAAKADTNTSDQLTTFPGSAWSVLGNVSPVEKGNLISSSYVEQGINIFTKDFFSVIPYVSLSPTFDTKGYDWNNRLVSNVGLKLAKRFDNGMVSVSGGYANETRFKSGDSDGAPFVRADTWFGWKGEDHKYPGSVWGVVGNISPVEHGNVIGVVHVEQGVVAHRFDNGATLVPFVEATITRDSKKYDWNNRQVLGAGLKLNLLYQNEHRKSGASAKSVSLAVKFWFGWNPSKQ